MYNNKYLSNAFAVLKYKYKYKEKFIHMSQVEDSMERWSVVAWAWIVLLLIRLHSKIYVRDATSCILYNVYWNNCHCLCVQCTCVHCAFSLITTEWHTAEISGQSLYAALLHFCSTMFSALIARYNKASDMVHPFTGLHWLHCEIHQVKANNHFSDAAHFLAVCKGWSW